MEIKNHYNIKILKLFNIRAITFNNHIFYSMKIDEIPWWLKQHELTHVKQYRENGVIKFLSLYVYYYFKNRLSGLDKYEAYLQIPFEIEARKVAGR